MTLGTDAPETTEAVTNRRHYLDDLAALGLPGAAPRVAVAPLPDEPWADAWRAHFRPVSRGPETPITPRPAVNLVIYHGVLAPRARCRAAVVRYGRPEPDATAPTADTRPRGAWTWAVLMHRVFALDVLACPRCGGRLQVIAIVQDLAVVRPSLPTAEGRAPRRSPAPPHRPVASASVRSPDLEVSLHSLHNPPAP